MPAQISIDFIVNKVLDGICQAQKDYFKWTGGDWLWNAPEYFLNVYTAQNIAKLKGSLYLTLENNATTAITDAGARGSGKLHSKIRPNGRFDTLLWWGNSLPRAVIELKNQIINVDAIEEDIVRIQKVLERKKDDTSFQFGIVAYYTSCRDNKEFSAKERLQKRTDNIFRDAKKMIGGENQIYSYTKNIRVEDNSAWVAAALLIK